MVPSQKPTPSPPIVGRALVRCEFCRRSAKNVRRLVRVPIGFVCDACVDACAELLAEADAHPIAPERTKVVEVDLDTRCAVCDTIVQPIECVDVKGRGGPVCRVCVETLIAAWLSSDGAEDLVN